jgi:hypothetical protein
MDIKLHNEVLASFESSFILPPDYENPKLTTKHYIAENTYNKKSIQKDMVNAK